jgi:hypothetical protein
LTKTQIHQDLDEFTQCDLLSVFHNITTNCSNDIEVAHDECKVICIINIMKGNAICNEYLLASRLLTQLKGLVKCCVYKQYEMAH